MMILTRSIILILTVFFCSCSVKLPETPRNDLDVFYIAGDNANDLLAGNAPIFLVRDQQEDFNRIGSPAARSKGSGEHEIFIDTEKPVYYTLVQHFKVNGRQYTNLIYRIHFPETPLPNLTAGKNVGLLVYVTIDGNKKPLLVTTLHTCGCYLAFIPTSNLSKDVWPDSWVETDQMVYGKRLPSFLESLAPNQRLLIDLDSETHRVRNITYGDPFEYGNQTIRAKLQPMSDLEKLPLGDKKVSLFETEGLRKGYVKGSHKRLEMLLMSWWAMAPFIGEDKALGPPEKYGVGFYTSLKFWARKRSNIWFFPEFLEYWGWRFDRQGLPAG